MTHLIRKSMIEEYKFCPYKFKKSYIDNNKTEANQAMLLGTRFHEFAEKFFDYPDITIDDIKVYLTPFEINMFEWFIQTERDRLKWLTEQNRSDEWIPLHKELNLTNLSLGLTGTIDRIDWIDKSKGTIRVVEYKTSKKVDDASLRRQLGFYAYLYDNTLNSGKIEKLRLINPRLQVVIDYDVPSVGTITKHIDALRSAIDLGDFPPKCNPIKFSICKCCSPDEALLFPEDDENE